MATRTRSKRDYRTMRNLIAIFLASFCIFGFASSALATHAGYAHQSVTGPVLQLPIPGLNSYSLGGIVSAFLVWFFSIAGITSLIFLILGGFRYLTSQGDPKATAQAQQTVTAAVIGLLIVFASYWIAEIIQTVFGITILSYNLATPALAQGIGIGGSFILQGGRAGSPARTITQVFPGGIGDIISFAVPALITVAGLAFLGYLIMGAFRFVTSGGDQKSVDGAKKTITYALIGLLIVFASYWIIEILQTVTGIGILR